MLQFRIELSFQTLKEMCKRKYIFLRHMTIGGSFKLTVVDLCNPLLFDIVEWNPKLVG